MDSQYKSRSLAQLEPVSPAIGGLLPLTATRWAPFGALMRAQDTIPATSRRIVAEWGISGAADFAQPRGTDDPNTGIGVDPAYPLDTWRTLGTFSANVTPGCELVAEVTAVPSGLVVQYIVASDSHEPDGVWGEVRCGVTWTNGASTTGPHYRTRAIPGSSAGDYGGAEADGAGQTWSQTRIYSVGRHRPPGFLDTPATAAAYSEWSEVAITLGIRGGARPVHFVVYEQPLAHTTSHDRDGVTSVHAMPASLAPLTPGPMIEATQGATYEEHRHGTRRTLQVAERQSERLGPRIMHWTCWDEGDFEIWTQTEGNPVTRSSAGLVHLLDSSIAVATYGLNTPGWIVGSAYAQLARLCDPTLIARGAFAAVPVRVRVDASQSAGTGTVRVQCGPYDWVDVSITGGRAVYERTGIIEGQATADHAAYPLAVWLGSSGGTLSVYSISVDFGSW
jgi:hypothetical protein